MFDSIKKAETPRGWASTTIGDVTEKFLNGGTPSTKNPEYWQGSIPWTTSSPMTSFYLDRGEYTISKEGLEKSASNLIPKNNVLIATRVGIGKVSMNRIDVAINQDLTGLILDKTKILPEFFVWALHSKDYNQKLKGMSRGTTIKGLIRSELERFTIPLPPLPEQRRIATILSTVDDAIQRSRQAVEETERLKAGVMHELMTKGIGHTEFREDPDVGRVPKEWDVKQIHELCHTKSGGTPSRNNQEFYRGSIPWLKSGELNDGMILASEEFINDEAIKKSATKIIPKGTVLIALYGATVGKVGILGINAAINQAICALQIKGELKSQFLFYHLLFSRNRLLEIRTGGAQPNISQEIIKSFRLCVPPFTEQLTIVNVLMIIDHKLTLQRQRTAHYEKLKQGLMNELLTGKRRVVVT